MVLANMFPRLEAVPSLRAEMQSWDRRRKRTKMRPEVYKQSKEPSKPTGVLGYHQRILDLINKDLQHENQLQHVKESNGILQSLEHMQGLSLCLADFVTEMSPAAAEVLGRVHSSLLCAFEKTLRKLLALSVSRLNKRGVELESLRLRLEKTESKSSELQFELEKARSLSNAKDKVLKSHRTRASALESEIERLEGVIRHGATLLASQHSRTDIKAQTGAQGVMITRSLVGKVDGLSFLLEKFRVQEQEERLTLHQMEQLLLLVRAKAQLGHFVRKKVRLPAITSQPVKKEETEKVPHKKVELVQEFKSRATMTKESIFPGVRSSDGVQETLYVSGSVSRRTLWWKAFNYARCKKCQTDIADDNKRSEPEGPLQSDLAKEVPDIKSGNTTFEPDRGFLKSGMRELNVSRIQEMFGSSENSTQFTLPMDFAEFLVHLPESVLQMNTRPVNWLLEEVEGIYNLKYAADVSDRQDSVRLQSLGSFLIEHFLFKYDLRRLAEVRIYELLRAIFGHQENERVRLFAQFVGTVPYDRNENAEFVENDVLQVILHVRYLLTSTALSQDGAGPTKHEGEEYVTLDLAIDATKHILQQFLSPRKLSIQCRILENLSCIETSTTNGKGERIVRLDASKSVSTGSRMTVRLKMRNAMVKKRAQAQASGKEGLRNDQQQKSEPEGYKRKTARGAEESRCQTRAVVRVHDVLQSMVKILQMRKRAVKTKLQQAFIAGDEDGNGVLSFSEFEAIISTLNPDMSQRQCLRLFRSAITEHATNNSLSITPQAFEQVCRDHDVLPLVDFRALSDYEA